MKIPILHGAKSVESSDFSGEDQRKRTQQFWHHFKDRRIKILNFGRVLMFLQLWHFR